MTGAYRLDDEEKERITRKMEKKNKWEDRCGIEEAVKIEIR